MSLQALAYAIEPLPLALAEQVLGYARSVQEVANEIFLDAQLEPSDEAIQLLIFIAGIKKLFAIVDSNYWVMDNAGEILRRSYDSDRILVGASDLSRHGQYYDELLTIRIKLEELLSECGLMEYVEVSYSEIAWRLLHER